MIGFEDELSRIRQRIISREQGQEKADISDSHKAALRRLYDSENRFERKERHIHLVHYSVKAKRSLANTATSTFSVLAV